MATKSNDATVIPASKRKVGLIAAGALVFVVVGGFLYSIREEYGGFESHIVASIGIVCIIFFGSCAVFALRKLFDSSPAVIISAEGILDNSSGISAGLIRWSEIKGMWVTEVQRQKFLTIDVHTPDVYVDRGNVIQRYLKRTNAKLYGSPVQISANGMALAFDEFLQAIDENFQRFGPS